MDGSLKKALEPKSLRVAKADVDPTQRQGGSLRALLTPASVGATDAFLGTVDLEPGQSVSELYHPYSDKFLYVVDGEVDIRLNGEHVRLRTEESLMVRRGTRHRFECPEETEARLVFTIAPLAPRPELGHVDTEPVPHPEAGVPRVG